MSAASHIILLLSPLPSVCQKLSTLVEIRRSCDKNNFAHFLNTVYYALCRFIFAFNLRLSKKDIYPEVSCVKKLILLAVI